MENRQQRMRVIVQILNAQVISNQEQLTRALSQQGIEVTQATLSRDLRDLRAEKKVMNNALTAKQIADILLEHPDAYVFKLGGTIDRYKINWTREVAENYFPHSFEEFLNKIPNTYKVIFASTYTLPFLKDRIYEDFGFQLEDTTHGKILLELK